MSIAEIAEIAEIADRFDAHALLDEFRLSNLMARSTRVVGPTIPEQLDVCSYCGRRWRRWANSKLDGHAACIVTEDFKQRVREILRSPAITYANVADAIGVTPSVVRAWSFPIRRNTVPRLNSNRNSTR